MVRRNSAILARDVFCLAFLGVAFTGSASNAQEAIVLETIGAVRFAQPESIRKPASQITAPANRERTNTPIMLERIGAVRIQTEELSNSDIASN